MKSPNGPLILIVFCALVAVVSWVIIASITTPTRAVASGVALAVCTGIFIWFANTDRFAIARGLIALGATALAAPLSAIQAFSNDFIFSALSETHDMDQRMINFDQAMQSVWSTVIVGAAAGIVLMIAGGIMHRSPRD